LVLESIQEKARFVKAHENELAAYAEKLSRGGADRELKQLRQDLDRGRKRCKELDFLIQKLFEQNATGLLTNERFAALSGTYEAEQKTLKANLVVWQQRLTDSEGGAENAMKFFLLVRKYSDITELSAPVLTELIESVVVYAPQGRRKSRTQKAVINFRFIKDNWLAE
jgi:hypothetical protein